MPWPGQTEPDPAQNQVIALRLLNPAGYFKTQVPCECLYDFGSELAHVWPFEEQTDKLASVCTCPCRHTLKLLNSWFFFFFNVTVNNEYGMSSNHHRAEISSTKKTGKTMQIKWDFLSSHTHKLSCKCNSWNWRKPFLKS